LGAADLATALGSLLPRSDARLLVGHESFDDAAVYRLSDDLALVQTVDFFAPIVDDPFDFGRVAATNALSDVYAMGGEPMTALAIAAFPAATLPMDVLGEILRGGQSVVHDAGALLVGGHTIIDEEVKFGLAVTGRAHPDRLLTNAAAEPGDVLVLTKGIGTGLLATQGKRGRLSVEHAAALVTSMTTLNATASRAALAAGARCATDVTGFGLLGHASHIARASHVTLRIRAAAVPRLGGVDEALRDGARTGGAERNAQFVGPFVAWGTATEVERSVLLDPQTSGGLLVALRPTAVDGFMAACSGAVVIGDVIPRTAHPLEIT
jgi:selenide,water dikinase